MKKQIWMQVVLVWMFFGGALGGNLFPYEDYKQHRLGGALLTLFFFAVAQVVIMKKVER